MRTTIALGNSPSSGSSLLSNLLDCSPFTACGPELNLFSCTHLYDYERFKYGLEKYSGSSSIYVANTRINYHRIHSFGHSKESFKKLVVESKNLTDFLDRFALHYLALRGKDIEGVVFEKTPENLTNIRKYLETTDNYFVHIVRDPVDVYKSLIKRGMSNNIALLTWFFDEAIMYNYLEHERVIVVKYEELLKSPYQVASKIIEKVTGRVSSPSAIQSYRETNHYRKLFTGLNNLWKFKTTDKIESSNSYDFSLAEKKNLSSLKNLKVSNEYASCFEIAEVSFMELLEKFGYEQRYHDLVKGYGGIKFDLDASERVRVLKKAVYGVKTKNIAINSLACLTPVKVI